MRIITQNHFSKNLHRSLFLGTSTNTNMSHIDPTNQCVLNTCCGKLMYDGLGFLVMVVDPSQPGQLCEGGSSFTVIEEISVISRFRSTNGSYSHL